MDDFIGFLFWCCFCTFPFVLVGGVLGYMLLYRLPRNKGAAARVAAEMGLLPLNEADRQEQIWYGGERHGYPFALIPFARSYYQIGEGRRTSWYLRLAVGVPAAQPFHLTVRRDSIGRIDLETFTGTFVEEGSGRLASEAERAMLDFARQEPVAKGLTISLGKRSRTLGLHDRADMDEYMDPAVLPTVPAVLVHNAHIDSTAADIEMLLDDLIPVAYVLATSQSPSSLTETGPVF